MYLTRLELDTERRSTLRLLSSPERVHGAVESAFPGERKRRLWRIDRLRGKTYLMLLSAEEPELGRAMADYGTGRHWETRDYTPLLQRISTGSRWRFRLRANPTVSKPGKQGERGKVTACITEEEQVRWLLNRAEEHGFHVEAEELLLSGSGWETFEKGKDGRRKVQLRTVTYDGVLTVTEPARFETALRQGIGRAKAYGMGLLTIMSMG